MLKALVFGANGYIGSHLVYFLKGTNFRIKAFDIQEKFDDPEVDYFKLDITKIDNFKNIDWNVDYIYMFAGITGTNNGFDNYYNYVNINEIGLLNILNEVRNSKFRPRIVYPSTRLVYKGSVHPLMENDKKNPKTIYAVNKIACENNLELYRSAFDIPYTIYRICVPYGNTLLSDYSYGTIGFFLNQVKNKGLINLYGDGSLRRTFTNIVDICNQIISTSQSSKSINQIYNTIGEDYSLKEIATLISQKYNAKITFSEWPEKDFRIESGHTVFNSEKIKNDFEIDLKQTVKGWLTQI